VLILPRPFQRYREEKSLRGIYAAAGVEAALLNYWDSSEALKAALHDVRQHVLRPKTTITPLTRTWRERHPTVNDATVGRMIALAKAETPASCLKRAQLQPSTAGLVREQARQLGIENELEQFLRFEGDYRFEMSNRSGLVAGGKMFLASAAMWKFRDRAEELRSQCNIAQLATLPHFDDWFYDWTRPHADNGRRVELPEIASVPAAQAPPQGKAQEKQLVPATQAARLTAQCLPAISRLYRQGKIGGRKVAANRLEVDLVSLSTYLRRRDAT
jgi:hypothetical protein